MLSVKVVADANPQLEQVGFEWFQERLPCGGFRRFLRRPEGFIASPLDSWLAFLCYVFEDAVTCGGASRSRQGVLVLRIVFRIPTSFLMHATIATLGALPSWRK